MILHTLTQEITPEMAKKMLLKNFCNRGISIRHRDRMVRAMRSGEFRHTHQGIAFDTIGNLVDGQHRLAAIVESGITQTMQVTYNVPTENRSMIDGQSRPRSVRDSLVMDQFFLSSRDAVSLARMWMELLGECGPALHEIKDFMDEHSEAIEFACKVAGSHKTLRHACILAMMAIGFEQGYHQDIEAWAEVVKTGVTSEPWQSSATRFRDWWMVNPHTGGGSKRNEYCRRIYSSMSAWVGRRSLSKLFASQKIDWISK